MLSLSLLSSYIELKNMSLHFFQLTNNILQNSDYDPVLTAATIAFGFVFIHPLTDGN